MERRTFLGTCLAVLGLGRPLAAVVRSPVGSPAAVDIDLSKMMMIYDARCPRDIIYFLNRCYVYGGTPHPLDAFARERLRTHVKVIGHVAR